MAQSVEALSEGCGLDSTLTPTNLALFIRYPWHFLSEFFGKVPIKKRNDVSHFRSKHFIHILTLTLMLPVKKGFCLFLKEQVFLFVFNVYYVCNGLFVCCSF